MTTSQPHPLRLGWLSTGRGPGSRRLLSTVQDAIQRGALRGRIEVVFCNREPGEAEGSDEFLRLAQDYGLSTVALSSRRSRREHGAAWRAAYGAQVLRVLGQYPLDLLVFAGFMLVMEEAVVRAYPALNLHPALPGGPQGTWQEVIWQLMHDQAVETGAMVQLATEDLDRGPAIAYCRFPIRGPGFHRLWHAIEGRSVERVRAEEGEENLLFTRIRQEGVKREVPLLIATLRLFADGRARIMGRQVVDASGRPLPSYDLTDEIEALVGARTP